MSRAASSLLWTGEQHVWLRALGHTVWVPGSLELPSTAPIVERAAAPAALQKNAPRHFDVAPQPVQRQAPARQQVQPSSPSPHRATRLPDPLHFALIRASGLNPNTEGALEVIAAWPDTATLRGNPAAKRALWPHLRALRRKGMQ